MKAGALSVEMPIVGGEGVEPNRNISVQYDRIRGESISMTHLYCVF